MEDRRIAGVPCRIYGNASPVSVVYVHGGGFVVGGLDTHDDVCAEIADALDLQVISIGYRLAPEHLWPSQIRDVEAVWKTLDTPAVIVGDSAGGMLTAALSLSERGRREPLGQVLIYLPVSAATTPRRPMSKMPTRLCCAPATLQPTRVSFRRRPGNRSAGAPAAGRRPDCRRPGLCGDRECRSAPR